MSRDVIVSLPPDGFALPDAIAAVKQAGLPAAIATAARGPYGHTSAGLTVLEALTSATDIGFAAAAALEGHVRDSLSGGNDFTITKLEPTHFQLIGAVQAVVTCDILALRLAEIGPAPNVSGSLGLDGLDTFLQSSADPSVLAVRLLQMARSYLERHPGDGGAANAATTLAAFAALMRSAILAVADKGTIRPMVSALTRRRLVFAGHAYDGLQIRKTSSESAGLLPIWPEDIVGNEKFLAAGLRLARDVAGYDFENHRNPKQLNPVLFGLGKPGCGKTVTAHAIGNYFLRYTHEHGVPSRFITVRRTDWASSYQNASALNLVRIFEEEVYGFDGVCGVYWPDIDTAFASRGSNGLRMEEKQNLGAVFGVFDGTLLPRDGKWFLICDANTMNMDEATVSRIAQNPFTVTGPTNPEHFVALMRDLKLRDVAPFLDATDADWLNIGAKAVDLGLSGRGVEAICGNIRSQIQNFEYPDAYFQTTSARRQELIAELSTTIAHDQIIEEMEQWATFHADAESKAQNERFQREVNQMVHHLNAGRAAALRATAQDSEDTL